MLGPAASDMWVKTARLKVTPAFRHWETSQGRYIAVFMQTEVNDVAWSTPGLREDEGSWRNFRA
jgi:hypothetical protein